MKYFAKLGTGNIVTKVSLVVDEIATTEQAGIDFLNTLFKTNDVWKQTFIDGSQRKHYAGIGFSYREDLDAFIPIPVFNSWVLNETTCNWEAPIAKPITTTQNLTDEYDGSSINDIYYWNEQKLKWEL
jgi:hypothetical protein